MKKTYIQPAILLTKVATQNMICLSDPKVGVDTKASAVSGDQLDSRGFGWDDDED